MSRDPETIAKLINEAIKRSEEYQAYKNAQTMVIAKFGDKEAELQAMQQQIVNLAYTDEKAFEQLKEVYLKEKNSFENDRCVINYKLHYTTMVEMLEMIKEQLENM